MIAHALRITGYDTELDQRDHAPEFLRVGLFLSACVSIGLFSFFRDFGNIELISTYGLWFLIQYNGLTLPAIASILLGLSGIFYSLSNAIFPGSPRDTLRLAWRLLLVSLTFITLYLASTSISLESAENLMKKQVLEPTGWYRSYLADDTFMIFLPLALNNVLMGIVAYMRDGDFFATRHRVHLLFALIPAALSIITMLPYDVIDLKYLYLYLIGAAVGYVFAFALSLQFEYGKEA
jgi:hypothetical protein